MIVNDFKYKNIYKIPSGGVEDSCYHICYQTFYSSITISAMGGVKFLKPSTDTKFNLYKPIYFERFKYLGKGFKLVVKRKLKFLNCVFGHSHIYWVRWQTVLIKRTKKYRFMFVSSSLTIHRNMIHILKNIKPINRYTLRGVRTYTHPWVKRKGRKSIATHI